LLGLALLLPLTFPTPLSAQDYWPDFDRIEEVAIRAEAEPGARRSLEAEGRALMIWAGQRRLAGREAHLVARVALALGAPFSLPDSAVARRELIWRRGAVRALWSALAADSGDAWAALQLERLEPYPHLWIAAERELPHLRALVARHDTLPMELTLAAIRMELERGDTGRAGALLPRVDSTRMSPAAWWRLRAEIAFARGAGGAAEGWYYRGAEAITDGAEANRYRADLEWIATAEELDEWDGLPTVGRYRADWLRRFWARKDLLDLRAPGTRLADHFARWRLALREYRWDLDGTHALGYASAPAMGLEYNYTDIKFPFDPDYPPSEIALANRFGGASRILDDRGRIVMRHGPPTKEAALPGVTAMGQAMMAWDVPGGRLSLSFSRPAISTFDSQPNMAYGMIARNMPVGGLLSGCQVDPQLCVLAGLVEVEARTALQSYRAIRRYTEVREVAESTEGDPERVAKELGAAVQAYGIPGGGVLVVYAMPLARLGAAGDRVTTTLRVVVGDSAAGEIVTSTDTTRRWQLPREITDEMYASGYLTVPVPVGSWRVGVFVADSARTVGSGRTIRDVPVIAPAAPGLQLGDPILGREASGLVWMYRGRAVPLNPTGAWRLDEPGVLTVMATGLDAGSDYRFAIELWSGSAAEVSIVSDVRAAGSTMLIERQIDFGALDAGEYRLVIRLIDAGTGESVSRSRRVPLVER
jgi:hypothetical protein